MVTETKTTRIKSFLPLALKLVGAAVLTLLIVFFIDKKIKNTSSISSVSTANKMADITGWSSVTEKFSTDQDMFCTVNIPYTRKAGESGKKNEAAPMLSYSISDEHGKVIAASHMSLKSIPSYGNIIINFSPVRDSRSRAYTLRLVSNPKNNVLQLYGVKLQHPQSLLKVDGKQSVYEVAAGYGFKSSRFLENLSVGPMRNFLRLCVAVAVLSIFMLSFLLIYFVSK